MHFAGLKSVTESVKIPLNYYEVNISGSINLINAMKDSNVNKMFPYVVLRFSLALQSLGKLIVFPKNFTGL